MKATITIADDLFGGDNVINNAESQQAQSVHGTVGGATQANDPVTVTIGGVEYETTVNDDGETWSVEVPANAVGDLTGGEISATVTGSDSAGNPYSDIDTADYGVSTDLPQATITIADDLFGGDNVINNAESQQAQSVHGTVDGAAQAGDPVTVTIGGVEYPTTVNDDGETWSVEVPADAVGDLAGGEISATVSGSDSAGNPYSDTDTAEYGVSTDLPKATITIADDLFGGDNVINNAESQQAQSVHGTVDGAAQANDPVTVTIGGVEYETTVNDDGETWSVEVPANAVGDLTGGEISATVSGTDGVGNPYGDTDTADYTVNFAPESEGGYAIGKEDSSSVLKWNDFDIKDTDSPESELGVLITGLPADGKLQFRDGNEWTDVEVGNQFSQAQIEAGDLRFMPVANESGFSGYGGEGVGNKQAHYAKFGFKPTDALNDGQEASFTIDIRPVADKPDVDLKVIAGDINAGSGGSEVIQVNGGSGKRGGFDVQDGQIVKIGDGVQIWLSKGDPEPEVMGNGKVTYYYESDAHGSSEYADVFVLHEGSKFVRSADDFSDVIHAVHGNRVSQANGEGLKDVIFLAGSDANHYRVSHPDPNNTDTQYNTLESLSITYNGKFLTGGNNHLEGAITGDGSVLTPNKIDIDSDNNSSAVQQFDVWVSASLTDDDGSEILSGITLSAIPQGSVVELVNAAEGIELIDKDGEWLITNPGESDVENIQLKLSVPFGTKPFDIKAEATSTEVYQDSDGNAVALEGIDTATGNDQGTVVIAPVAPPTVTGLDNSLAVSESYLEDGTKEGDGEAKAQGSFTISSAVGIAEVTIAGKAVSIATLQAIGKAGSTEIVTVEGNRLVITGYEGDQKGGTVSYEFVLENTVRHTELGPDEFTQPAIEVSVKDALGQSSRGAIGVTVIDDVPVAVDEQQTIIGASATTVTGNVTEHDTLGADGAHEQGAVSSVEFNGLTLMLNGETIAITGEYGKLTISPDGSYTYETFGKAVDGVKDTFTYQITDGDGDIATATLAIDFSVDGPKLVVGSNLDDDSSQTAPPQHHTPNPDATSAGDIQGGSGDDILIGDTGGAKLNVEPGGNYNIALVVDVSASMNNLSGTDGLSRIDLTKLALTNLVNQLSEHAGAINISLIPFARASNQWGGQATRIEASVKGLSNDAAMGKLLDAIDDLYAESGTNYSAGFNKALEWFNGDDANSDYENLTFFLTDGNPTFYGEHDEGPANSTDLATLRASLDAFNQLTSISNKVHAIGIGQDINKEYLQLFDNTDFIGNETVIAPSSYTLADFQGYGDPLDSSSKWNKLGGSDRWGRHEVNDGLLKIFDGAGNASTFIASDGFRVSESGSTIEVSYRTSNSNVADTFAWKIQQLGKEGWVDASQYDYLDRTASFKEVVSGELGAGTYRVVFAVDNQYSSTTSNLWIDHVKLSQPNVLEAPAGQVQIVNTADELDVALKQGSEDLERAEVGDDILNGGEGDDLLFGDAIYTDHLDWEGRDWNGDMPEGSGYKALTAYLEHELGRAPGNAELYDYISKNFESLIDPDPQKGGDDTLIGGPGNDMLIGGLGADTFKWEFADQGTVNKPAEDQVMDFTRGVFGQEDQADRLDLADLLQGESSDTIDQFIHAEQDGSDTILHIKSQGGLAEDNSNADQRVVLKDVSMPQGESSSDFLQSMLQDHQLKIDQ
nr:Ig-like domain-containing protein [Halomonas sp. S3-1-8]